MSVIFVAVVKAATIIAVALLAVSLADRSRAAIRHVVLAGAFLGLLVLPIAQALLPRVAVPMPIARSETKAMVVRSPLDEEHAGTIIGTAGSLDLPATASVPALAGEEWLIMVWRCGVLLALLPLLAGAWELRRIRRCAWTWADGEILVAELSAGRRVRRRVEVLINDELPGPMTCGVLRPAIVFPVDVTSWDRADIRRAMRHELEHVGRADCLVDGIARLTCTIYWFLPHAWLAWRRLRLEAERACDDAVVRDSEPIAYAEQLVSLAARVAESGVPLLAMAGSRDLPRRITALLDRRQHRGRAGGACTIGGLAAGLALTALIAPLSAGWQEPGNARLAFEVASIKENTSGDPFGNGDKPVLRIDPGGRLTARNVPLASLLLLAYRAEITRSQLAPVEGWMERQRFDIDARAADGVVKAIDREAARKMDAMLQALLADRFKLRVRRDSKTGDTYVLAVAPGGVKMKPSTNAEACAGGADPQRVTPLATGLLPCHLFTRFGRRGFEAIAIDTADLADVLREVVKAPVEDRARLATLFDASVTWNSDPLNRGRAGDEPQPADDDPDVTTALREQLGLRLERQRGPVETLIVESAEPPLAN